MNSFYFEDMLRERNSEIQQLRQQLDALRGMGVRTIATVIAFDRKKRAARIILNQAVSELSVKPSCPFLDKIEVGASLEVNAIDGVVLNVCDPITAGSVCTVLQVVSEDVVEVQFDQYTRCVFVKPGEMPKPGDRGLLDPSCFVFMKNLGRKDSSRMLGRETTVTFDDIGGQEEAKRALREALIEPYEKRSVYKHFNMRPSKGVLLWGPPGTGKTMLAGACASALAELHGKDVVTSAFIYVKGPELLNKFIGETESSIRKIFASAREHQEQHNYPAVIFVDEADALLGRRGSMHPGFEGLDRTIVPQFLSEMDGMHDSGAFVLLATNRPDILDPAVVRDRRIDRKVHVRRPTAGDAFDIFQKLFAKKPTATKLAERATETLYSDTRHLWNVTTEKKTVVPIYLRTLASGAMIDSIVERSAHWAIREGAKRIDEEHVERAIADVEEEQRHLTHDLNDFMDALDGTAVSLEKVAAENASVEPPRLGA